MANLCIIPARGGSKRIPGKNTREFMGKPMLAYPIINALETGLFDEVMVSTDDEKTAEIASLYKAKVPFLRSEETSGDTATTAEVIMEVIEKYTSMGQSFDYVCCMYPCTPLLNAQHIKEGYSRIFSSDLQSVMTVQAFGFPVQRALKTNGDKISFLFPEYSLTRSQDLEKLYHDAGQFYWINTGYFLSTKTIVGIHCGYIVLSEMEAQDIDSEEDWKMAELKYKMKFYK